ncbi:MAG: glycosyltransferase family 39 protein [Fuerstiella sp.]
MATDKSNLRSTQLCLAALVLILVAGIMLRAAAAVIVDRSVQQAGRSFLVEGDANGYWELAQKLAAGEDYAIHQPPRRVLRVPGFSLMLAASIKVFGNSILAARFLLAGVGTACCLLTYILAHQLMDRKVGLIAAAYLAVHPLQVANSVLILSENWFTFWMLLSLISLTAFLKRFSQPISDRQLLSGHTVQDSTNSRSTSSALGERRAALLTGILIGITVLIRPGYLPWVGFCVLAMMVCRHRTWGARTGQSVLLVLGCLLVMMPWAIRNQQATGHFVLTSLWSGPSLYDGLNPQATGASDMKFFDEEQVMNRMSEYEMNRHYSQRAVQFAVQNPRRAAVLGLHKAGLYLMPVPNFARERGWVVSGVCAVFWLAIFAGAGLGLSWMVRGGMTAEFGDRLLILFIAAGPFLLFLLVHLAFVGSVRYRLPVEFPLSILASSGWIHMLSRTTDNRDGIIKTKSVAT